jgi:hypothetical protein
MALACMRMRFFGNLDGVLRSTSTDLSGDLGNGVICLEPHYAWNQCEIALSVLCQKVTGFTHQQTKGLASPDDLTTHCPLVAKNTLYTRI